MKKRNFIIIIIATVCISASACGNQSEKTHQKNEITNTTNQEQQMNEVNNATSNNQAINTAKPSESQNSIDNSTNYTQQQSQVNNSKSQDQQQSQSTNITNNNQQNKATNTTNSSKTDSSQEIFYGRWKITKVLAYGPVGTYSKDQAQSMIGKNLNYSKDNASYENNISKNPAYKKSVISKNDFQSNNRISLNVIGVKTDTIQEVEVNGLDGIGHIFYIKNNDTLILFDGGVYFELNRY